MTNDAGQQRACPRCGTEVTTQRRGPVVVSCGQCGTEVSFAGVTAGMGHRIAHADTSVPAEAGLGAGEGAVQAPCQNCGAAVPLRGTTPAELLDRDPTDIADTVTCPNCGVEVAAATDQSSRPAPTDVRSEGGSGGLESVDWRRAN